METKNSKEEQNGKYNIKSLIELNPYYYSEHCVTQADINTANRLQKNTVINII
ncbi:hypothetical protein [Bacteroides sp.]|jgi:hypothetical protein|uniref:hypothetical protein n=1 Tax=Bacteroides sp. TaxID=29523 RepID=UPI00263A09A5|nr:hypothetical protein [Bacteroides sp.]MDD3038087.1 hypothetical protein [Bacteroides sp.]